MTECPACGGSILAAFRYCPWCAAPTRRKLVEFFAGVESEEGRALRVSRYPDDGHVRVSVWSAEGVAEAAVSVPSDEADRLAAFLDAGVRSETPTLT